MWNKRAYRPLFWALLLSLLAHWVLIGHLSWFEWDRPTGIPIMVELASAPLPVAVPPPKAAMPAKKTVSAAKPKPAAPLPPPPEPARSPVPDVPPVAEPPPPAPEIPVVAPMLEKEIPAPVVIPVGEEDMAYMQPEEESPPPPRHVEIEYRILRKGGVAGVERHSYLAGEDGRYSLTSVAEPKGLLVLALSDLVQKSEGVITEQGLRPATYLYQYGKNPDKAQKATFDWQAKTLVMETGGRHKTAELTDGVQDLMSFMYQFMFTPPLQEMHLAITNGKRLKTYDYSFDGEETLETAMGALRCMHIVKSSGDGEEKAEVWLAADYHYLPVKISKTEKDGTVTERIATRLQIK